MYKQRLREFDNANNNNIIINNCAISVGDTWLSSLNISLTPCQRFRIHFDYGSSGDSMKKKL